MAGRPLKMVRRVEELEETAIDLSVGVYFTIPEQYLDSSAPTDPICAAWNQCVKLTMLASLACERLGDLLRGRAGITEPSPRQRFFADAEDGAQAGQSDAEKGCIHTSTSHLVTGAGAPRPCERAHTREGSQA